MKSGMTLVEVMIAAALMTMALAGLLATLMISKQHATATDHRLTALQFARGHMEQLMDYNYNNAALSLGTHSLPNRTNNNCVFYSLYQASTSSYPRTKDLEVKVSWRNPVKTNMSSIILRSTMSYGLHP